MATRSRQRTKLQGQPRTKRVIAKLYQGGEAISEEVLLEEIDVVDLEVDPAYVRVSNGFTGNLGNYQSMRLDVSISVPCYPEQVEETFEEVAAQVNDLLMLEVERLKEELSNA